MRPETLGTIFMRPKLYDRCRSMRIDYVAVTESDLVCSTLSDWLVCKACGIFIFI